MMEAGEHRLGDDPAKWLDRTASRCVLAEGKMGAGLVVVAGVEGHDPAQVSLAQHHHMVEALASYRADQSLHMRVLLGRAWNGRAVSDTQAT